MPRFPSYFVHYRNPRLKWNVGLLARLPECYKEFYEEWQYGVRTPVHWIPKEQEYARDNETGEIKRFENHEIPAIYPPESHSALWGGEGVLYGFEKRKHYHAKVPMFWTPFLKRSVIYSEILDKYLSTVVTERVLHNIDAHKGLDFYLLKTSAADLQSLLALKLKRFLYQELASTSDQPDVRTTKIRQKYDHLKIPAEHAEWYGLSLREACEKLQYSEEHAPKFPLKNIFRQELIEVLKDRKRSDLETREESTSGASGWLSKIPGFKKAAG
ncbi:unnamed protein product [Notodromas monacha]|uniref:Large ribosomal subunit protein bL28m n=1 Tax=Notodromas monacha TaxID=399045 RepID=A0A7R9BGI4_9CRUS|nr:unnamed protein product [Notodromas monacha]CAG0913696.1 unnamed protein product [Notodromas monacha]